MKATPYITRKNRTGKATTWVAEWVLCALCGVDEEYLKDNARVRYRLSVAPNLRSQDILPDTGVAWRWGVITGCRYYDLARIPSRAPTFYGAKLGTIEDIKAALKGREAEAKADDLKGELQAAADGDWPKWLHYYSKHEDTKARQLARAAAVLAAMREGWEGREAVRSTERSEPLNSPTATKEPARPSIVKHARACADALGEVEPMVQYLPKSWRALYDLLAGIGDGVAVQDLVKLPREGNVNSVNETWNEAVEGWVISLRGDGRNLTAAHIYREVKDRCKREGVKPPSMRWVSGVCSRADVLSVTAAGRWGEGGRFANAFAGYLPMQLPNEAGAIWQADASRVNMIGWYENERYEHRKTGEVKTRRKQCYLMVAVIRDVASGAIIGRSYGYNEDRWMYIDALRQAYTATGYLPTHLVTDRFPGYNTKEWQWVENKLNGIGCAVTYSHKATAKAGLERWFGTWQSVFLMRSDFYYGEGIKSSRATAHRNPAYLALAEKAARECGWDFDKSAMEADYWIEQYNTTRYSEYSRKYSKVQESPVERLRSLPSACARRITKPQAALMLGTVTKVTVRGGGLLKVEVMGIEHYYRLPEGIAIMHMRTQVYVAYGESMKLVHVFEVDATRELNPPYLCECEELQLANMIGSGGSLAVLGRGRADVARYHAALAAAAPVAYDEYQLIAPQRLKKAEQEALESAYVSSQSLNPSYSGMETAPDDDEFDEDAWLRSQY